MCVLLLLLHCDVLCCALCASCCQPVMCLCVGVLLTLEGGACPLKLPPPASCGPSRHPPSPTLSSDSCVVHSTCSTAPASQQDSTAAPAAVESC
jgi:hypothetical protein